MFDFIPNMLQCPACGGVLKWNILQKQGERIWQAEASCLACQAQYPVRDGVGLFLTPDLPRQDLWEAVESGLSQWLHTHPDIEQKLLEAPRRTLAPADEYFRGLLLEERGQLAQAKDIFDAIDSSLYTPEYLICQESQRHYIADSLKNEDGPVVDLASGRGYLVETLARETSRPIIATDFSPSILRRDQRWFQFLGLDDRVSFLAFDARRTPFKDRMVATLTTNQGLANIREPGALLVELRRIVAGRFLAIANFYPEHDETNAQVIDELGLSDMLFRSALMRRFAESGWQVASSNCCAGPARPTPKGSLLPAGIDTLPVAETVLDWCTLEAE